MKRADFLKTLDVFARAIDRARNAMKLITDEEIEGDGLSDIFDAAGVTESGRLADCIMDQREYDLPGYVHLTPEDVIAAQGFQFDPPYMPNDLSTYDPKSFQSIAREVLFESPPCAFHARAQPRHGGHFVGPLDLRRFATGVRDWTLVVAQVEGSDGSLEWEVYLLHVNGACVPAGPNRHRDPAREMVRHIASLHMPPEAARIDDCTELPIVKSVCGQWDREALDYLSKRA